MQHQDDARLPRVNNLKTWQSLPLLLQLLILHYNHSSALTAPRVLLTLALYIISSTGRASNLTSPSTDFSPSESSSKSVPGDNPGDDVDAGAGAGAEKIKHSSSSIIGLRAATFDTPKSSTNLNDSGDEPKPRPPPKPRPWSIVGVDRKSGEFTSVETENVTPPSPLAEQDEHESDDNKTDPVKTAAKRDVASRGSVRDMIANLNKPEDKSSGSVGGLLGGGQSVRDRIASMNQNQDVKKKGNSLPRTTVEAINPAAGSKSPGVKPKNSPHNMRKENTEDDPRILKLDDDFMFEDTVNV